jgi:chaperone required for assembly of F1-ATPase
MNVSVLAAFNQQQDIIARARQALISYFTNLASLTSNSIKLQSSALAQLTQATNQLTRDTLVRDQC